LEPNESKNEKWKNNFKTKKLNEVEVKTEFYS